MSLKKQTKKWENLPGEVWKEVPESAEFLISNMGRVKKNDGALLLATGKKGTYRSLSVKVKGARKVLKVHRLVLTVFARSPLPKEFARHANGDLSDNRLENLAWCSLVESRLLKPSDVNPVDDKLASRFDGRTGTVRQARDRKTP
jgi:hypothetical protein